MNTDRYEMIAKTLKDMEEHGINIKDLAEAIAELKKNKTGKGTEPQNLRLRVENALLELGTPSHIKGYQYTVTAIMLVYQDEEYIHNVTKRLYVDVAKKHGSTPSRIERSIRHGIEFTFDNAYDEKLFWKYFGNTVSIHKGKPTNSQFIAAVTNYLRRQDEDL